MNGVQSVLRGASWNTLFDIGQSSGYDGDEGRRLTLSEGEEEADVKECVWARGVRHEGRDSVE